MTSWDGLVRAYIGHLVRKNQNAHSVRWKERELERAVEWLRTVRQRHDPAAITEADLLAWLETIGRSGIAPGTYNNHVIVLRQLFLYAAETGAVLTHPARFLENARTPRLLVEYLTREEIRKVLEQPDLSTARGLLDRAVLELLYSTGIRCAELIALDLADLDAHAGTLTVREGKGQKDRVVPVGATALAFLARYVREARRPEKLGERAFFLGPRSGRRIQRLEIARNIVQRNTEAAGLKKRLYPHLFRHSCAVHMLENGADLRYIQKLLGHSQLSTTQFYTRVLVDELRKVHRKRHPRSRSKAEPPSAEPLLYWRSHPLEPGEEPAEYHDTEATDKDESGSE